MAAAEVTGVAKRVEIALGRGGHLLAILVAVGLGLIYLCGGQLRENPAKLVLVGFFVGTVLDAVLSVTWRGVHGLRQV